MKICQPAVRVQSLFVDLGRSIVRNPPRLSLTVNVARRCHGLGYLAIAHFRLSTDKSRTTFYRYHTMRRMMHAAAILLAIATQVQAQYASTVSSIETPPSLQPDLSQSAEVNNELEMSDPTAKQLVHQQRHSGTQFIPRESGRNYSQLASYMSCNDWSPNLWNNYACERAAIAARISQHVDKQCKCFESHQCKLHSPASGCGACDEGKCNVGTGPKLINRYRQPVSTLYSASSDSCGPACSSGCGGSQPSYPASAMRPMVANPPRDRVASPVVSDLKGSFSVLNTDPSPSTLR